MTLGDLYLQNIVNKKSHNSNFPSPSLSVKAVLEPLITRWSNGHLLNFSPSGSFAKGTGVVGSTDIDLFISLRPATPNTLKEIFDALSITLQNAGYQTKKQNVAIAINVNGFKVDLVPARKQEGNTNGHSLFSNKKQSWLMTNCNTHISLILNSGRREEIKALKIWRNLNNLDFPSFYLELIVLQALRGKRLGQLAENVLTALKYLADDFRTSRLLDPANTNNVISEGLTAMEKLVIASAAKSSCLKPTWDQIIW